MSKTKIVKQADGTILVERFPPIRRIEHIFVMVVFTVLCLSGFPQKHYDSGWAIWVVQNLGGLDTLRSIHRITGIVFALHLAVHVGVIAWGVLTARMRMSLLPTTQDIRDVFATLNYYLGRTKEHPIYPKFDYRQKFEYIGIVLGGGVMIFSGLALFFPALLTAVLPGEIIPAARVMHSNEALLALLVLTVWHIYGSHFSPEVFPMDKSVFTGFMTAEELKHKHRREYDRLFPKK